MWEIVARKNLRFSASACHEALEWLRRAISLFMRVTFPKTGTHFWVTRSSACHEALEWLRRAISLFMRVTFPKTGTHFWVTRSSPRA